MPLGELGRRDAAHAAVRPDLVVVLPPDGGGAPGLLQGLEPLLVEVLVPELAVEALDVAILHRPAWLDQDVPNAMRIRPAPEGAACELRAIVSAHSLRVASEEGRAIEQPRDVQSRNAPVYGECPRTRG
jgi:hypothetical protein